MKPLFAALLALATFCANAQFLKTSKDDAFKIKNSKLIVALDVEDEKLVKKLGKRDKEELFRYRMQIRGRNEAIQNAVEKYWNFSNDVVFLPLYEAFELLESDMEGHVLLQYGEYVDFEQFSTGFSANGKPTGWYRGSGNAIVYNPATKYTFFSYLISSFEISSEKSLAKVYLPSLYPSKPDAVFGIQHLEYILNYLVEKPQNEMRYFDKQISQNAPELKEMTLLIDEKELDSKLKATSIKEYYPYPYKVVSQAFINKAILQEEEQYAYIQIVQTPSGKQSESTHAIVGAKDGKIYYYLTPNISVNIKSSNVLNQNVRIKAKHFEKYAKEIEN